MGCRGESEGIQVSQTIFLLSCLVLAFVPLYFVLHSVYQDGIFGRGSLLGISFCSIGILLESIFGNGFYVPPIVSLQVAAFAVFSVWHLVRFERRVLKKESQWTPSPSLKT